MTRFARIIHIKHRNFLLCLLWLLCAPQVFAQTSISTVPPHIRDEVPQASMQGTGSFRWYGLHIYDAALWSANSGMSADIDLRQRFALDLRYARHLLGSKIADASMDEIQHLGMGSREQRERWLQQMKGLFPDVKEGTHITGIYVPNEAARFYLNGKWLGDIRDAEFAKAFFSIWLDKKTSAPALRQQLLSITP
ncbi:chalcone isomerase family protein [Undibacterium sp. SXout7W]|uniref:chalcone isomerase family protein n=1 Tax=Undibacterium sp. SXout7W TaxID=3413049 RepID=UPI003BF3BD29